MTNEITPVIPAEMIRQATDIAGLCKEIVTKTAVKIQDRQYVRVEGWMSIATAHGCCASARTVEQVPGGIRAIGEVRRMSDGAVLCVAEGFVGEDEPVWYGGEVQTKYGMKTFPRRAEYAIRAMAQTRAVSRACRTAFAHVVVLMDAGLSTMPAEEIDGGENSEDQKSSETPNEPKNVTPEKPPVKPTDWKNFPVPVFVKKYAGKTIGEMEESDLIWWITNYMPTPFKGKMIEGDLQFRAALDEADKEITKNLRSNKS